MTGDAGGPGVLMTWDPNHLPRAFRHEKGSARASAAALEISRRVSGALFPRPGALRVPDPRRQPAGGGPWG